MGVASTACKPCGSANPDGARLSGECGARLGEAPAGRASAARSAQEFTPRACALKHRVDRSLASRSALEGERKQVTVRFAGVKGSMELAVQIRISRAIEELERGSGSSEAALAGVWIWLGVAHAMRGAFDEAECPILLVRVRRVAEATRLERELAP